MHQYSVVVPLVVAAYYLSAALAATSISMRPEPDLSFAESVYAKLSGACRAIMDLRYNSMTDQKDLIKTMKIIQLDGSTIRTFPINEAFVNLTKPGIFDITKQTKIVIHGYKDSSQSAVPLDLATAYNDKKMFNVFLVDAEEMNKDGYILSAHNARLIGKRLANLLANLEHFGANAEDFHLLGISLGAHIAGWAGKYFQQYKARSLGRITGLDPAGPCFSYAYSGQRLDKSDAAYVDVLHSNRLIQGIIEPLGHADFYINGGGPNQPGCFMPSCSHLRAAQVYTESIKIPMSFVGVRCQSWKHFEANACEKDEYAVLGYGSSTASRGLYYLRTSPKSPFGLGMDGVKNIEPVTDNWLKSFNMRDLNIPLV
ncbi:phospholipase A1 [Spodoptera frugiperda]|uniref:Phospholipase A1 n=1 Tax=Spodoptera frugiperda TaxID=7108 RepID=A0A9R0EPY3_SPOFR|nr:phospholipase A1 [Spodoptera frugiperda]